MNYINKLLIYRKKLVRPYVLGVLKSLNIACYVMSIIFIVALVYEHGFRISYADQEFIHRVYKFVWGVFLTNSLGHIIFNFREICIRYNIFTWVLNITLLLTLLPSIIKLPTPYIILDYPLQLLGSHLFRIVLLVTLSLLQISNGVVKMLSRRVNPSAILSTSFFIFILIGTAMLMLPRSTVDGISLLDALFMSTSAVCVTGLATVDIATTVTPMGTLFILILIQIGGLGVMTLTSFFAMFFMGNSSLYNQVVVSDMISSKSLSNLLSTLLYILGFTFIIELSGAVIILFNIHNTLGMTLNEEIGFAVFHSISAFCNAGFSTLPNNLGNELLMSDHNIFYITITALIILGGIGFPILVNLYQTLRYYIRRVIELYILRRTRVSKQIHLYDINTRIVLIMTILLLALGSITIAILEWDNGFSSMPTLDKITHSIFNAACPRTAGFSSVSISSFSVQTIMLLMLLMAIGGGTQSTAGGIKVNVFAVVILNIKAILYGRDRVTVFNRELSQDSIRRSNSTLVLYIFIIFIALFSLTIFEPDIPIGALLFEAISALSTVGSSLDITMLLGSDSKLVIVVLMFVGRVGVLTMMTSLIKQRQIKKYNYPSGNIIIN